MVSAVTQVRDGATDTRRAIASLGVANAGPSKHLLPPDILSSHLCVCGVFLSPLVHPPFQMGTLRPRKVKFLGSHIADEGISRPRTQDG